MPISLSLSAAPEAAWPCRVRTDCAGQLPLVHGQYLAGFLRETGIFCGVADPDPSLAYEFQWLWQSRLWEEGRGQPVPNTPGGPKSERKILRRVWSEPRRTGYGRASPGRHSGASPQAAAPARGSAGSPGRGAAARRLLPGHVGGGRASPVPRPAGQPRGSDAHRHHAGRIWVP